jgi:D-xylulose kinase
MPQQLIAAIDVGTTGARTIIFDIHGDIKAIAYQEYPILTPKPDWIEQDANQWWLAVCSTSKTVLKGSNIEPTDILGIAITNQRETIVPVNKDGEPLHNALVWQDRRTTEQCKLIEQKIGADQIYETTGLTIDPYFSAPKLMWLKQNKPNIFQNAHKFLLVHDFIVHKLTGEFATDHSNASRTMLFDINSFDWSSNLTEEFEISIDKLPQLHTSGTLVGEITTDASTATGFRKGTPVIAGGGDQQCAALGLGVIQEGIVEATTGTGTFVIAHLDEQHRDPKKRVLCSAAAVPNKWILEASIFTTGSVYRWFRDNFAELEKLKAKQQNIDVYELLNQEIAAAKPGANGLLLIPHFAGAGAPHWNPNAKGVLHGLSLGHTRCDVLRAIIEGVCFEIKKSIDVLLELGLDISELRIAGGATRSEIWNQLQADIYGVPVIKSAYEETTAVGAAILACIGADIYKTSEQAIEQMVEQKTKFEPREKEMELYKPIFLKHKELYQKLQD